MRGAAVLALLILAGCATDYEGRMARCDAAAAVILTYKAAQAAGGRESGVNLRMAEAAAETLFVLRCPPVAPPLVSPPSLPPLVSPDSIPPEESDGD